MRDFTEAVAAFQREHGKDWYLLINSPAWRAARALAIEHGPDREMPNRTPAELLQFGAVYAAIGQGYHVALDFLDGTLMQDRPPAEIEATYGAEPEAEPLPKPKRKR